MTDYCIEVAMIHALGDAEVRIRLLEDYRGVQFVDIRRFDPDESKVERVLFRTDDGIGIPVHDLAELIWALKAAEIVARYAPIGGGA